MPLIRIVKSSPFKCFRALKTLRVFNALNNFWEICGKRKGHSHTKIHTYTSKLRIIDEISSSLPKIVDEMISTTMFMTLLLPELVNAQLQICQQQSHEHDS